MTESTKSRNIKLLIEGTLKTYGIDNLKLEIDLFSGVRRILESAEPVRTREKILASLQKTLEVGALEEDLRINMESRVKLSMGIDVSGRDRYREMIEFLVKKDAAGQSIEHFAEYCRDNPFNAPKPFQIAEKPHLLQINWPSAFAENVTKESEFQTL